ncbi:MAG: tRNA dihydrouridine(16) synthase DusC [Aliivibrio sp.]|uniref:tRNA dihydrouridine(16) synthase DusC n=1 Tax=Aliivibrio sp. TaxID=1872443 RepID=UPI001A4154FF|nr:tRNA dihydrouridine(16) synthase DusC [Aliivibrio sp.]
MRVILGPMEGVLDHLMRDLLTQINDYDLCVTEFIRVIDMLLPEHVFYRICPELHQQSKTSSGTPVRVQLLGQEPDWMAENANRAVEIGSDGVDLNFGCPAKAVNKSRGGAALLKTPDQIYNIVKACRDAVPSDQLVTAKIRLGWESPSECFEIADAVYQAGANELTVHARTKVDGYKAEEIKWDYIKQVANTIQIPVIANGEIWNHQDAKNCIAATGIDTLMVCRGAFNLPNLGNVVKYNQPSMPWSEVIELLLRYSQFEIEGDKGRYYPNRVKQWLVYLRQEYPQAKALFTDIRCHKQAQPIVELLEIALKELSICQEY